MPWLKSYTGLGEKDKAFEWLEKGYERHSLGLGGVDFKVDSSLGSAAWIRQVTCSAA